MVEIFESERVNVYALDITSYELTALSAVVVFGPVAIVSFSERILSAC